MEQNYFLTLGGGSNISSVTKVNKNPESHPYQKADYLHKLQVCILTSGVY